MSGEDVREGLTAILSIKHPDPSFDSQTKCKLVSSEVKGIVETVVSEQARRVLRREPADRAQDHRQDADRRQGARGGAQGARDGAAQGRARHLEPARQARRLPGARPGARARSTSSRVTAPAAAPSRAATGASRRSCRCAARSSTSSARASRRCSSSAEIGTLITALGCGVDGGGNFDIEKLRYHHIILMTDADVDGSHIRTLLLTFFYRQMPEVIRRGYLYIAQPPLYKVSAARRSSSSRTTTRSSRYLLDAGIDGLILRAEGGVPLTGEPLRRLLDELGRFRALLGKLGRKQDGRVIEAFVRATELGRDDLRRRGTVESRARGACAAYLMSKYPDFGALEASVRARRRARPLQARRVHEPRGRQRAHHQPSTSSSCSSGDFEKLREIEQGVRALGKPPFYALDDHERGSRRGRR